MAAVQETVDRVRRIDVDQYRYGFETEIEFEKPAKGLSEDTVRFISAKKNEPAWMLEWRLEAFRRWLTMTEPTWARVDYPKIDYQDLYYYSAPKPKKQVASLDEIDPEILKTYEKLGIPLREVEVLEGVVRPEGERRIAVDAVFDSVSVATTFQKELKQAGVIFMPISEAIREHPDLVKKYLGTVVPTSDNFFATLNSAVFSDGSFVYVPPGVRCPMELSTYFRINERNTGQFERTLIIADKGAYVSYLEGCTAPQRDENQLHAAVVELVALDDAEIKYSTVQNWYPGNSEGKGGIYNFVTKRGDCRGTTRRSPGPRSRPALRSPGNIRAAFCAAITLAVSSIRSRSRTATSRSIAAPRCCISAEHHQPHHLQRHCGRAFAEHLSRAGHRAPQGDRRAQLHRMQLAPDRRQMRRAHRALSRRRTRRRPSSTRRPPRRSPRTCCSIAPSAGSARRRRSASSSTALSRTCCSSCRWSSRSRRRS